MTTTRVNDLIEDTPTINVNMDQEDRDIWARSEGYTPLADFHGGGSTMMMMAAPPSAAADGDDDDDDDCGGSRFGGGAFFVDIAAFGPAAASTYQDENSDDNDGEEDKATDYDVVSGNNDSDQDFRTVADSALSSLDEEYARALHDEGQAKVALGVAAIAVTGTDPLPPQSIASLALLREHDSKFDFDSDSAMDDNLKIESHLSEKIIPFIDTDAVRRAVQAINLRTPNLVTNMSKWQERLQERQVSRTAVASPVHAIIPKAPLQAFRKRTAKAIQATGNLTRSATLAEGLHRVLWSKSNTTTSESPVSTAGKLILHVVGVDHVECASPEHTRTMFGPLVRWLGANLQLTPRHLEFHLVGPNIPATAIMTESTTSINLMPTTLPQRSCLQSAVAFYHRARYHDWWSTRAESGHDAPHLIVCFNAGIWGYDEWRPTIQLLGNLPQSVPFIATAYTMQEAEDDWDTIRDVLATTNNEDASNVELRCIWNVEANPFASKLPRPTATAVVGREYRENAAWQAWRFGRDSSS
jgi:hypothetical protein